eukprot:9504075-Heterocapsa_arctica.AAC.1
MRPQLSGHNRTSLWMVLRYVVSATSLTVPVMMAATLKTCQQRSQAARFPGPGTSFASQVPSGCSRCAVNFCARATRLL